MMEDRISPELVAALAPIFEVKIIGERLRNVLLNNEIHSLDKLLDMTEAEFLRMPNFGRKTLNALKACLAQNGLHLNGSIISMSDQALLERMRSRAEAAMHTAVMMQEAVLRLEAALRPKNGG